ncbi:MAG TPA: ATP-binding protein [Candidatus Limnocylindria bacterium]|nr:ATP-binding protein [Candidatus Limnocylindria bacterium]
MSTQLGKTQTDSTTEKPWVLLVEDEPTVSKIVGKLLDEAGYEHVSIADHNQIAAAILHWNPRCIILDSEPGSAGHERSWADAAAIRRAHPDLPVLMFTADPSSMAEAREGTTERSKAAGYAGVIDKPLLVVEFLATLKNAVDSPQPARVRDNTGLEAEAVSLFPDIGGRASTNWAVSDFFGVAVHELRTPLMSISGQAQLAQRYVEKDPKRATDALTKLLEQTKRMDKLIGDLLDYGRVGSGALSLEVVTFDLGVATAITIAMHEHEDTPRITFTTPKGVRIQGDPDRIAQILGNLLDNAIKYSAPGAPIDVSLSVVDAEAHLRIADQGLGVPEAERGPLFAPFFRTTRTRDIPGTGLGLHISRRIAEQHRGRLWLETSSSVGSVFVLALPLAS